MVVDCHTIHEGTPMAQLSKCPAHWLWNQVTNAVVEVLSGITLEELTVRTADCPDWYTLECPSEDGNDAVLEI